MTTAAASARRAEPHSLSASMVLFRNPPEQVRAALASLRATPGQLDVCVVDNSPEPELRALVESLGARYVHDPSNPGFGASHNRARRELPEREFHLVVNPDVYFPPETLPQMMEFLREREDVGLLSPRVLFPDGEVQHLCKRYPSLLLLFGRRFVPRRLHFLLKRRMDEYEMRDTGYDRQMDVPLASGCFMLFRTEAFARAGGFDERFWLYMEDFDLSLRVAQRGFRILFFPEAHVFHHWARGSHRSWRLTLAAIRSSLRFFSKHHWKLL